MTDKQLRAIFHAFIARASDRQLEEISATAKDHSQASAHYGINAQVQANTKAMGACDSVIDDMQPYYKEELIKRIEEVMGE